jgi:hypothetical protein
MAARGMAMPKVRGRFKVGEVTHYDWDRRAAYVKMESVEGEIPDANDTLMLSTKSASVTIMITNPAIIDCLPLGKHFFLDLTPVD